MVVFGGLRLLRVMPHAHTHTLLLDWALADTDDLPRLTRDRQYPDEVPINLDYIR